MGWKRVLVLLAALVGATPAAAQDWPARVVRIVTPYPPGASNDIIARLLADSLAKRIGQSVVVENKPGGGTAIGTRLAAQAAPDGYTLLFGTSAIVGNIHVLKDPQYS